jgi:hypothetical protein
MSDASPGFTVWTETVPGQATNWYFVLPNVYGRRLDGQQFSGLAIELTHGVAVCWDGRVIRHGTSIMNLGNKVLRKNKADGCLVKLNNVYGTFCAAKTRLVDFGRDSMLGEAQRHARFVCDLEPDVDSTAPLSDSSDHGNNDGGEDAEQPSMQHYVIPRVGDDTSRKFPAPIVLVPERLPPAALPHAMRVEQARLDRIERDKARPLPVALQALP